MTQYKVSSGIATIKLFDEDTDLKLESKAVLASLREGTDMTQSLLNSINHGYHKGVYKLTKAALTHFPEDVFNQTSSVEHTLTDTPDYTDLAQLHARELMQTQVAFQQTNVDKLYEIYQDDLALNPGSTTYTQDYQDELDRLNFIKGLVNTATVNIIGSEYSRYIDPLYEAEQYAYELAGVFIASTGTHISNVAHVYPHFTYTGITRTQGVSSTYPEDNVDEYSIQYTFINEPDGTETVGSTHLFEKAVRTDSGERLVDRKELGIRYTIDTVDPLLEIYMYVPLEERKQDVTYTPLDSTQYFPTLPLRSSKKNLAETDPDKYSKVSKALKYASIDSDQLMIDIDEAVSTNGSMEDVDDVYVGFYVNPLSKSKYSIKYMMEFLGALKENIPFGSYDIKYVYNTAPHPDGRDNVFQSNWATSGLTEEEYEAKKGETLNLLSYESSFPQFNSSLPIGSESGFVAYEIQSIYRAQYYYSILLDTLSSSGSSVRIDYWYIYSEVRNLIIGKEGTISSDVKAVLYGRTGGRALYVKHLEYYFQISPTHCKVIILVDPVISFINTWTGREAGTYTDNVTLHSVNRDMLLIPANYNIARGFSGFSESYLTTELARVMINTIHVEKIPGWKVFLQILVKIILFIVSMFVPGMFTVLVVLEIVMVFVNAILSAIESESIKLGVSTGVSLAIGAIAAVFGSVGSLIDAVIQITLYVINTAISIVSTVFQAKSLEVLEELADTREEYEEQAEEINDLTNPRSELNLLFLPNLTVSENIDNLIQPLDITALYNMASNYVTTTIELPEIDEVNYLTQRKER